MPAFSPCWTLSGVSAPFEFDTLNWIFVTGTKDINYCIDNIKIQILRPKIHLADGILKSIEAILCEKRNSIIYIDPSHRMVLQELPVSLIRVIGSVQCLPDAILDESLPAFLVLLNLRDDVRVGFPVQLQAKELRLLLVIPNCVFSLSYRAWASLYACVFSAI